MKTCTENACVIFCIWFCDVLRVFLTQKSRRYFAFGFAMFWGYFLMEKSRRYFAFGFAMFQFDRNLTGSWFRQESYRRLILTRILQGIFLTGISLVSQDWHPLLTTPPGTGALLTGILIVDVEVEQPASLELWKPNKFEFVYGLFFTLQKKLKHQNDENPNHDET